MVGVDDVGRSRRCFFVEDCDVWGCGNVNVFLSRNCRLFGFTVRQQGQQGCLNWPCDCSSAITSFEYNSNLL